MATSIRLQHPVPGARLTDRFGWRAAIPGVIAAQLHNGQDFAAPAGTPIYAAHDSIVRAIWWDGMGGNMIRLGVANYSTEYAHMLAPSPLKLGQAVRAGVTVVGYVGSTGASTGPHLHFILKLPGGVVDPLPYLTSTPTQGDDDMYTPEDRARDNETRWLAGQIKEQVNDVQARVQKIHAATDVIKWGTTDDKAGLRKMVAGVAEAVKALPK